MYTGFKEQDNVINCFLAVTPRKRLPFRWLVRAKINKIVYLASGFFRKP